MVRDVVERLAEARLRSYNPTLFAWQRDSEIRDGLGTEIREVLDRAGKYDSLVELPDGLLALTGIRYRGGDMGKPFVDIVALEGSIDEARLQSVINAVAAHWDEFSPLCIRLPVPAPDAVRLAEFGPHSRVDLRLVAGRVADIVATPHAAPPGELTISAADDMSWYGQYRREYHRFLLSDNDRNGWTQPDSYESLDRAVDQRGLYLIRRHGLPAGVYSMPPAAVNGLRGFRVQEKLLFGSIRGTGLGSSIEYAVIKQLPAKSDDLLFGSIADGNTPSRKAAYSLGRVDIGARLWLTPIGRPGMP